MSASQGAMDVNLAYGEFNPQSMELLTPSHARIHSLDLSGNHISPEKAVATVDNHIACMTNLVKLDIKDNQLGPRGVQHLCASLMRNCRKLRYLDISENHALEESIFHVAQLLGEGRIETLFLINSHLTPRGILTLCDGVLLSRHITVLSLAFNLLGNAGASTLAAALKAHPTLRFLDLSDNRIGDPGAESIAEHLIFSPYSRLESLVLCVNAIGSTGFAKIAQALAQTHNRSLAHVDLGCNPQVGPAGRKILIDCISSMQHLRSLDLCSCKLSDAEAKRLVTALASNKCGIVMLEWYNNPEMSMETEKALHEMLIKKKIKSKTNGHVFHLRLAASALCGLALAVCIRFIAFRRRS
ncbi:putative leucine-rich repeat protein (LRRP) [Trypanosoma vivax]|nr:putative leucine-rich repeat protein (LRRP) [Trypanosoma vivax]